MKTNLGIDSLNKHKIRIRNQFSLNDGITKAIFSNPNFELFSFSDAQFVVVNMIIIPVIGHN